MKNGCIRKVLLVAILAILLGACSLFISQIRGIIIDFGSVVAHKTLNAPVWHERFIKWAIQIIVVYIVFVAVLLLSPVLKISKALCVSSVAVIAVLGVYFYHNISYPNFWFDESGQFWMAKGLNHFSTPFSDTGTLRDVITNNASHNLDPGGFTVLLHFITFLGNTPFILRFLPFAFFLLSFIFIGKIVYFWNSRKIISLFCGFILFLSPLVMYYTFELRAYSMEMFSTIFALWLTYKRQIIYACRRNALICGIVLAIGFSSRYSAVFAAMPLFVFIACDIFTRKTKLKNTWAQLTLLSVPIVITFACIYFLTLRYQNPTGTPPLYVQDLIFKYAGLRSVSGKTKILIPYLLVLILFCFYRKRAWFKPYNTFVIFMFIQNIIFIVLSITGKYPWGLTSRWDISTHTLFIVSIIPLCFIIVSKIKGINTAGQAEHPNGEPVHPPLAAASAASGGVLNHRLLEPPVPHSLNQTSASAVAISLRSSIMFFISQAQNILFVFIVLILVTDGLNFRYHENDSAVENLKSVSLNANTKILINYNASPTVRYLFEYGEFKDENKLYPASFALFKDDGFIYDFYNNKIGQVNQEIDNYDFVVLSHYYNTHLEFIESQTNWENCTVQTPGYIFRKKNSLK
ncbi:MAG: glycosyltransferase family 39 protein [Clostridiales bacterium]|jgi:hypothetical protein|nr:glycosyltransferase family 39 protein [Clostridiales bacterium]